MEVENILNLLYKLILTLNATSWMIVIYGIKEKWSICSGSRWIIGVVLLTLPVLLSWGSLAVAKKLSDDSLTKCQESMLADNEFIPIYLGYFFVALSVPDDITMLFLYGIIFIFTFLSQTQYFNPLYLLFGYHYYHVLTAQGTRVFVIARGKVIRNPLYMSFIKLKRVNDTTYLSIGEDIQ